jgi:hypothetical protein
MAVIERFLREPAKVRVIRDIVIRTMIERGRRLDERNESEDDQEDHPREGRRLAVDDRG